MEFDDFDAMVAELTAGGFQARSLHEALHWYLSVAQLVQMLGQWDLYDRFVATGVYDRISEFRAMREQGRNDEIAAMVDRLADVADEVGRELGPRVSIGMGGVPVYLYAVSPCCHIAIPVVLDADGATLFDPEKHEHPSRPEDYEAPETSRTPGFWGRWRRG